MQNNFKSFLFCLKPMKYLPDRIDKKIHYVLFLKSTFNFEVLTKNSFLTRKKVLNSMWKKLFEKFYFFLTKF